MGSRKGGNMRGAPQSSSSNANEFAAKIVGFIFACVFTPPIWRLTASPVGAFVEKMWNNQAGYDAGILAYGVALWAGLYAGAKATTLLLIAALVANDNDPPPIEEEEL